MPRSSSRRCRRPRSARCRWLVPARAFFLDVVATDRNSGRGPVAQKKPRRVPGGASGDPRVPLSELVAEAQQGGAPVLEVLERATGRIVGIEGGGGFVADVADLQVQRQALEHAG